MMTWEDVLKIKNPQGENLIVRDVNEFTKTLRRQLDYFGLHQYAPQGKNPSKSRVVVKETYLDDETLQIVVSVRNPNTESREYFRIILKEDDSGDYYYHSVYGPTLEITPEDIAQNEYDIQSKIIQAIKRTMTYDQTRRERRFN